jgi:predicted CXXCH cytochrome family protein
MFALFGVLSVPCLFAGSPHPSPLDEHSVCLECHADHASGEHVHPAIERGCFYCHKVENRADVTYVHDAAESVCRECHQQLAQLHTHFPYASGMCLRCHNPHASSSPQLLRAKVNEICLDCHLLVAGKASSRYMPTIELTANNSIGHPYARHPVSGQSDPLTGGEMSCISCHLAHGGTKLHLLKMGSEIPADALNQNTETKDMCQKCHMRLWGLDGEGRAKHKKRKTNPPHQSWR